MVELDKSLWIWLTLGYCFVAAVLPVGLLLQPRDFLSAGFLYAILGVGLVGMLLSGETIQMPAFSGWESDKLGMLMPFLFITVACGACSGFHSIVSSGTTSKQIKKESDVRRISYGGCWWKVCWRFLPWDVSLCLPSASGKRARNSRRNFLRPGRPSFRCGWNPRTSGSRVCHACDQYLFY